MTEKDIKEIKSEKVLTGSDPKIKKELKADTTNVSNPDRNTVGGGPVNLNQNYLNQFISTGTERESSVLPGASGSLTKQVGSTNLNQSIYTGQTTSTNSTVTPGGDPVSGAAVDDAVGPHRDRAAGLRNPIIGPN